MRASRIINGKPFHISGAEGIYSEDRLLLKVREYYRRAIYHSRGKPDNIVITLEEIDEKPLEISLLPLSTLNCSLPSQALRVVRGILRKEGISERAIRTAFNVIRSKVTMRGAALVMAHTGIRVDPDRERGVRVSRLGLDRETEKRLSRRLQRQGINTPTVKEALVLASKVASCDDILAELCVSDDPDYTTGYVASRVAGYVRITNIKERGSLRGGRVFFLKSGATLPDLINYLEKRPVIAKFA